jgi:hypothetical protein
MEGYRSTIIHEPTNEITPHTGPPIRVSGSVEKCKELVTVQILGVADKTSQISDESTCAGKRIGPCYGEAVAQDHHLATYPGDAAVAGKEVARILPRRE